MALYIVIFEHYVHFAAIWPYKKVTHITGLHLVVSVQGQKDIIQVLPVSTATIMDEKIYLVSMRALYIDKSP